MKVGLLKPEADVRFLPYPLLYLAAALRRAGHEANIAYSGDNARDLAALQAWGAEAVGISALTGPNLRPVQEAVVLCREAGIPTVLGGVHASLMPEVALLAGTDFVVSGEGERAVAALADNNFRLPAEGIPGVACLLAKAVARREPGPPVQLDDYPLPWDLINPSLFTYCGAEGKKTLPVITSRGCPYDCAFCYSPAFHLRRWRAHSLDYVRAQREALLARVQPEAIQFFDDHFFVDAPRAEAVIALWDLPWQAEVRADKLTPEFARRAREQRCQRLFLGIESGSDRVREMLRKELTTAQVRAAVAAAAAVGLPLDLSFIVGFPGEEAADRGQTMDLIDELQRMHPRANATVKVYTPYPKTALWAEALRRGFQPPEDNLGWARFSRAWVELPWLAAAYAAEISLVSRHACCVESDLLPRGHALLGGLAKWRWRRRRFGFPWEAQLYRLAKGL